MLKGSFQQDDVILVNIYAPNIGASKYIKKTLEDFKKEVNSNAGIVGDTTPNVSNDLPNKNQHGYSGIKRYTRSSGFNCYLQNISFQRKRIYILLKCTCTFSKIDCMVGYKISLKNSGELKLYQGFSEITMT